MLLQSGCETTQPAKPAAKTAKPGDNVALAQGTPREVNPAFNTELQAPTRPVETAAPAPAAGATGAGAILEPAGQGAAPPTVEAPKAAASSETYVVVKGDSLARIAKKHNVSVADLKAANGLKSDTIKVGDKLTVPAGALSSTEGSSIKAPATVSAPKLHVVKASSHTYKVQKGDTVASIAKKAGCKQDLIDLNDLSGKKLTAGKVLKLPAGSKAIASDKAAKKESKKVASKDSKAAAAPASSGAMLPTDNVLTPTPAGAPASTTAPAAATPGEAAPAPVTVQPEAKSSSGLENLDNEPATPTVPVQGETKSSTEQP